MGARAEERSATAASRLDRVAGVVPLVLALAVGVTLVVSVALGYRSVREASETLVLAQSERYLRALHARHRGAPHPPDDASLRAFLDESAEEGLRFIAVGHGGRFASAGTPATDAWPRDLRSGITELGALVRVVLDRPLGPGPRGRRLASLGPGAAVVVVEFEPTLARGLARVSTETLALGIATAVLFVALALSFLWVWRRRLALERELARDRRLAALGEMSGVLAHEIRNPLASLKGHAQLLLEGLPAGAVERPKAERVVGDAVRLERLVRDLLSFVRTGELHPEEVDPRVLVADAVLRATSGDAEATPPVRVDVGAAPSRWRLDPERITEALTNLLRNALQASEGVAAPPELVARLDADRLCVEVRDHGSGLPPGAEDRIFDAFFTRRTHGTGLGLPIARRIVEQHGGTLTARNHPGGGAVFRMLLPREV